MAINFLTGQDIDGNLSVSGRSSINGYTDVAYALSVGVTTYGSYSIHTTGRIFGDTDVSGNYSVGRLGLIGGRNTTSSTYALDIFGTSNLEGDLKVTGKVGIGTTPSVKLEVEGHGIFNGSVVINENIESLRLGTTEASGGTYQTWHNASGRKGFFGYASTVNDIIYLVNDENSNIQLGTNGRIDDFIVSADGNVTMGANVIVANGLLGIGTTTLSNKLSLAGSGQNWVTSPAIKMWDSFNSKGWYVGSANNNTAGDFYIRSVTAEAAYPVAADQQFTIKQSGNVGIGTISPDPNYKLDVNGDILAGNVTATTNLVVNSSATGIISYGNRGKLGQATGFNPDNDNNGLWIEGSQDGESGGIFMNGNTMCLWSPGDNDILRVYDEDNFAGTPPFVISGSGKVGIGAPSPGAKLEVAGNANIGLLHTNYANAQYNVNLGFQNYNNGFAAIATGQNTLADADVSFSMGYKTRAKGTASFAGGNESTGPGAPIQTEAIGTASIAFGSGVTTSSNAFNSQAFGRETITGGGTQSAYQAMAIGYQSRAWADNSFAGGNNSDAFGQQSFAFGAGATASAGDSNIALGLGVTTNNNGTSAASGQVVVGKYNDYSSGVGHSFAVGTGSSSSSRYTAFCVRDIGYVGIGVNAPSYQLQLSINSAAKPSSNVWTVVSDERVKENIKPYEKGLNEILQVNTKTFDYNGKAGFEKTKGNIGIIAQEMMHIFPETINSYSAKLNEDDEEETELYNFDGHALTFALINAVKELKAEIEELKKQINK